MQRLKEDRGAVAVVVALLMIPVIGFAAIAIDVAAIHSDRQHLQTGADAAALAIATDCAQHDCSDTQSTADELAGANTSNADVAADVTFPSSQRVRVTTSGITEHWFAPALGIADTDITTSATVGWGSPSGGTAAMPLIISYCDFFRQTGGGYPSGNVEHTILMPQNGNVQNPEYECDIPLQNHRVPGGFGWTAPDQGECRTTSEVNGKVRSDPGANVPNVCSQAHFEDLLDTTVILPLFSKVEGNGNNAEYTVYGYAAFHLTGYRLHNGGQYRANADNCSRRCLKGYFQGFVGEVDNFETSPGAPNLGVSAVNLIS